LLTSPKGWPRSDISTWFFREAGSGAWPCGRSRQMPPDCEPYATAGASAGAIVAALMAIGERGPGLKKLLSDTELYALLDSREAQRFSRMSNAFAEFPPLLAQGKNGVKIAKIGLWRWSSRHAQALKDAAAVWAARGLYRSDKLRTWLDKVFGKATFDQIKLADLRVMASDVSEQSYVVYTKRTHPGEFIAAAVHASVNIPLFLLPIWTGIAIWWTVACSATTLASCSPRVAIRPSDFVWPTSTRSDRLGTRLDTLRHCCSPWQRRTTSSGLSRSASSRM